MRDGLAFADLPDSTYAADADEVKTLPFCKLKAVLTGAATIDINQASM